MTRSTRTSPTPRAVASTATPGGTARYQTRFADRYAADFYRPLGRSTKSTIVSSLGVGTYLGACDDAEDARYQATVRGAFERGVNLIDSAINYRCQRSERAVGAALREAIADGTVRRDEVVLSTKGGFLPLEGTPPATREEYEAYVRREFFDAGVLRPDELVAGGHSLATSFLSRMIERSKQNLGVRSIDIYYLHNPEQQLEAVQPARFRTIIRHAFALLEEHVAAGDIGCYGVASWHGFRVAPDARGHLSLTELVAIAREVAGDDHHFGVVQLPINLAMSEAVRAPTQRRGGQRLVPMLQAAAELGVSIVASATLMQAQLSRGLPPQLRDAFPSLATDAQRAIAFVRSFPAVASALVGMKSVAHLEENLGAARK